MGHKEQINVPFRPYLVCYDGYRCVGWRTKEELEKLLSEHKVDWVATSDGQKMVYTKIEKKYESD